jgi:hypothetical protein
MPGVPFPLIHVSVETSDAERVSLAMLTGQHGSFMSFQVVLPNCASYDLDFYLLAYQSSVQGVPGWIAFVIYYFIELHLSASLNYS